MNKHIVKHIVMIGDDKHSVTLEVVRFIFGALLVGWLVGWLAGWLVGWLVAPF